MKETATRDGEPSAASPRRRATDRHPPVPADAASEDPAQTLNAVGQSLDDLRHPDGSGQSGSGLAAERRRGEVLIGWVQLGVLGLFAILYAAAPAAFAADTPFTPVPVFIGVHCAFTLYRIHRARAGEMRDGFVAFCVLVDMVLLFGLIWSFHIQYDQPASFYLKAPTFLYVFIFIGLRALGFDARFVALAGACAVLGWLTLVAYAFADGAERTRSFVRYMTSNDILLGAELDKVVVVAVITSLLCFVVVRTRTLLGRQIEARREIGTLNVTLRKANRALREEATQRAHYQHELERAAYEDALTGLANRAGLEARMVATMAAGPDSRFAVLVLDLDRFRLVNGASGYAVGDEILRAIGQRLAGTLRAGDVPARLGNDEFAVFVEFPLPEPYASMSDTDALRALARRLAVHLAEPLGQFGGVGSLSACFGLVPARSGTAAPRALLRDAEIALERAKGSGAGTALLFETSWRADTRERRRLEIDLAGALREGALSLAFQPIVRSSDLRPMYFEALMRWQHPDRGPVSPAEFIPIAEATGMIHELGRFALEASLAQLERWQVRYGKAATADATGPLGISVNVSTRQFDRAEGLMSVVRDALRTHGVPPESLYLEMTESVLMTDPGGVSEVLAELTRLGPRLLLDDFGTGYSCFGLLPTLPLYGLKIDRSFVPPITSAGGGRELVKSILSMAARLNLSVVAEGVETEAQRERLTNLGCPLLQGYLIGRPMDEVLATRWLDERLR